MALSRDERAALIARYEAWPTVLRAAFERVPEVARRWRPAPGEWSAHEVIVHCADSETNAHGRIRYLVAEPEPLIVGYDEAAWAVVLDYHARPVEPAFAAVVAVRANTVPLLLALPEEAWQRVGRHTQSGAFSAEDWLRVYGVHLHEHADQIAANLAAWERRDG
jgi:hypothetical protein